MKITMKPKHEFFKNIFFTPNLCFFLLTILMTWQNILNCYDQKFGRTLNNMQKKPLIYL